MKSTLSLIFVFMTFFAPSSFNPHYALENLLRLQTLSPWSLRYFSFLHHSDAMPLSRKAPWTLALNPHYTSQIPNAGFKESQQAFPRVRKAYEDKGNTMEKLLQSKGLEATTLRLYLRVFKEEDLLEIWAKNSQDETFQLLKTYDICRKSGSVGPKRKQGDLQVPEGFYHIDRFNPSSNYHLSLGINYPNRSDRKLGSKPLGGDIFIHGNCVTIGCMPMTDDKIKEIYILCVEAKNNGQKTIPVTLFPAKLSDTKIQQLEEDYRDSPSNIALWQELKKAYDIFNNSKKLPNISFLDNGRHGVSD